MIYLAVWVVAARAASVWATGRGVYRGRHVRDGSVASFERCRHVGFTPDFGRMTATRRTDALGQKQTHAPQQIRRDSTEAGRYPVT